MMSDRKKVIYDIERCICHVPDAYRDCSHYEESEHTDCVENLLSDVLEMLKKQEPVEPYCVNTNYEQHWNCGKCDAVISTRDKFCHECGQAVKWE